MTEDQLIEVEVDKLFINPNQPRKAFDEEELEELSESIKGVGLLHPPLVRPLNPRLGTFELVSGERRLRACKRAGFKKISVVVRDVNGYVSAQAALIENVQRVDLNPVEVAKGFERLIEQCGFTQQRLADRMGKKRSTVANYLRLLTLPEKVQQALIKGSVTMGHAKAILSLTDQVQQLKLQQLIVDKSLSVREAERMAKRSSLSKEQQGKKKLSFDLFEKRLSDKFGTKVSLQGGDKGTIQIRYESLEELERLLTILG